MTDEVAMAVSKILSEFVIDKVINKEEALGYISRALDAGKIDNLTYVEIMHKLNTL